MTPLSQPGGPVVVQINAGETPTFGVFVLGFGNVPFLPGVNRAFSGSRRRAERRWARPACRADAVAIAGRSPATDRIGDSSVSPECRERRQNEHPRAAKPPPQLREELSVAGVAGELNPGGLLSTDREMRSLEILTKQVMPALK